MCIAITLHLLSVVIWIDAMFFAFWVLRPAASQLLELSQRLPLWRHNFQQFFPWVCGTVIIMVATGYWLIFAVSARLNKVGLHIHIMNGLGVLMVLLFLRINFRTV